MSKARFKHFKESTAPFTRSCDHADCGEEGEFRAPKSRFVERGRPEDYHWYCLQHIREFNKSWNFFDGMSDHEVLRYKDEDITGHRPTWKLGSRTSGSSEEFRYNDPFEFRKETGADNSNTKGQRQKASPDTSGMDPKEREALATLNLEPGCTMKDIKRRHKELAKKYHPDIRGGDKQAEEVLKNVNQAYTHLLSCGNS